MAHQFQLDPFRLLGLPTLLALSISAPGQAATFDIGEIQGPVSYTHLTLPTILLV